ncbi:MAG: V-type ATP synthase subunit D, partial [Candidatus Marinimicrobia bacterium]|jgi:V/A-type H+-transporting ATPase subunit D|nr:V-type ATP synthase subunit D [Candidatus Neomarinimicrobiota bacterium]MCK9483086.1 V-type ATP synthase subunit D [Candidatus Neomarinimicrobiota bacterium]MCK9559227.1 V-type ATP synthase subunit D [Candidatus Neomarinimicrobiota bacterium]
MGTRLKIVPTKSNLLKTKRDLVFAQEGYDLLEQKRQVLVANLMPLVNETITAHDRMDAALREAYNALQNAIISSGKNTVKSMARAVRIESDIQIHALRVMGVVIPKIEVKVHDDAPYYSAGNSSFWLDESILRFKQILEAMGRFAELRVSLLRLAREVRKTQRRVNALEKIAIPDYQETIKFITDSLEENERGALTSLKFIKERLEKRKDN